MIVEEKPEADEPRGPVLRGMRQHEAHRPDDMRGGGEQDFALDQRLAHQAEFVIFEIAQAAMDELPRARRGALGEIVLLAHDDGKAATGRVARNSGAVHAAADDEDVDLIAHGFQLLSAPMRRLGKRRGRLVGPRRPQQGLRGPSPAR